MTSPDSSAPWVHGRPIRSRRGRIVLPDVEPTSIEHPLPASAVVWVEAARHAISSVASFRWTALSLEAVGAPGELIQRALRAADDEHRHAGVALELAKRMGAPDEVRIVTDASELTRHRRRPDNLLETATSALLDGVVGEGFAARRFRVAAEHSTELQSMLNEFADDEERHSQLGVDILTWCVSVRPWVVDDLSRELSTVESVAPLPPEMERTDAQSLASVGMCAQADAQRAWDATMLGARELVSTVRHAA